MRLLFEEARAHLGVETQRQWSDKTIKRTTPILFGMFSLVCLVAQAQDKLTGNLIQMISSAWYDKQDNTTFADPLSLCKTVNY
ncbi:MAG: hypothetical protein ACK4M7_05715 [Burkholderiales bacterium]